MPDLVVIHEHPEWQKPLFAALDRRALSYVPFSVARACFDPELAAHETPDASLYFNQASPSAYIRGNTRAVPLALAFLRALDHAGKRVLNGADVFALELSKSSQIGLLRRLDIDHPRSLTFNDVEALTRYQHVITWPALLKPDQGGSGARIHVVHSLDHVRALFADSPSIWLPDNLFLLQELLPHDPEFGIVRLEFLGGQLLYAMRVRTHGRFNLCPSPVCNPDDGERSCEVPAPTAEAPPVEFLPYPEVPADAVATAQRLARAAGLSVGGVEYLTTPDGRRVFYDINANSNLRPSIAEAFGFDPFEKVADYLERQLTPG